jgi:hypothetical protein
MTIKTIEYREKQLIFSSWYTWNNVLASGWSCKVDKDNNLSSVNLEDMKAQVDYHLSPEYQKSLTLEHEAIKEFYKDRPIT